MNKQQQLLDEAELCESRRVLFAKPKSQICSLATRYINRATIVRKYHHGGRLRKVILSAFSSTCRPFIVLYKIPITGVKIYLVLAAQSPSPENKFNHCFFFSFPHLFAFYLLFCCECQGRSQPVAL